MNAIEKILNACINNKHICVGLDTDIKKIPKFLFSEDNPILKFNKTIIDSTAEYAGAYKLNFAFYEKDGPQGLETLKQTIDYIPKDILVIGDAKRGDIGNTSEMYAKAVFDNFNCDSITLNPYMGYDSIQPFLEYKNKISFILVLTSNTGSNNFEKLITKNGKYVFQEVMEKINIWNTNSNCGIVFGATNPNELKENISNMKNLFVLLPGIGAQGGDLESIVGIFHEANHNNFLLNISRALIYADSTENFGRTAKQVIIDYNKTINKILE
ncbi:MAG: orotidine-5'-phosphate decarboxylase [Ignavibacteriales bacterium]|nr:orotidine-5'-phosphate decarboxylase [Ignavibacteriales bacterium]